MAPGHWQSPSVPSFTFFYIVVSFLGCLLSSMCKMVLGAIGFHFLYSLSQDKWTKYSIYIYNEPNSDNKYYAKWNRPDAKDKSYGFIYICLGFPGGISGKEPTWQCRSCQCRPETWVQSLGWEDPLEKEMAIHCSMLAWKIPWTEVPGGLKFIGSQRVGHDWMNNTFTSLSDIPYFLLCWKLFPWMLSL